MKKKVLKIATLALLLGLSMQQAQAQSCNITSYTFNQPTCLSACDGSVSFTIPASCATDTIIANLLDCSWTSTTYTILPGVTTFSIGGLCGCSWIFGGKPIINFSPRSGFGSYGHFQLYTVPPICIVSTDSASNYAYNIISWNNASNVDSFIIHRQTSIWQVYNRIGAVSRHSLSEFKDTCRSIGGPNGGDPNIANWTYALQVRDNCGNYSGLGCSIETVYLQQAGQNFTWSAYLDSAHINDITGYGLYRDTTGTGNYFRLISTYGAFSTSGTDPGYSGYPNSAYRVDAYGIFNCNSTALKPGAGNNDPLAVRQKSHSNTNKPTIGLQHYSHGINLTVYPSPTTGSLHITSTNLQAMQIKLTDVLGNELMEITMHQGKATIDVSKIPNGVYFIRTIQGTQKFIKQ